MLSLTRYGRITLLLINVDLANVFETKTRKGFIILLGWGDEIEVVEIRSDHLEVRVK